MGLQDGRIMPTYNFKDRETGAEHSKFMTWTESEEYLTTNPNLERLLTAPMIVAGIDKKPESGFRDVLKRIKKASGSENTVETY